MDLNQDWQSGKTLAESNGILLDNEIKTDVTFVFPGSNCKVKAHKNILMSRSHVFYVMFTTGLEKSDEDIAIQDIEPAVFKQLLRFLYCEADVICADNALHLIYAAQKYQVEVLKAKCVDYLQNHIDQTTVALILDQAVFYNETKLTKTCLEYFANNKKLAGLNEYHVSKETLEVVIDYDALSVGEVLVFKACEEWANVECKKLNLEVNMDNRRKVLGSVLGKIRFCSMTQAEFANEVSGHGLLNAQEELDVFKFLCATKKGDPPFPFIRRIRSEVQLPSLLCVRRVQDYTHQGFSPQNHSPTFQISISAERRFTLFGFIFVNTGTFNLCLNENEKETLVVENPNERVFLSKPLQYETNEFLTISENTDVPLRMVKNVPFSHTEELSGLLQNTSFSIKCSSVRSTPFQTLLVTF